MVILRFFDFLVKFQDQLVNSTKKVTEIVTRIALMMPGSFENPGTVT